MQRAAPLIDVDPVRFRVQRPNLRAQLFKQGRREVRCGAMRTIQADAELYRAGAAKGGVQKIGVTVRRG